MPAPDRFARALWTLFEPIHAVSYFSPHARQAFADIGLPRYWDGYFAGRSAPLGAVSAEPVVAIFSGFAPAIMARALPAVWSVASPAAVLEARSLGAAAALREVMPDEAAVERAALAVHPVAAAIDTIGRPLSAANRALEGEHDPYRALWQSTATLREHRGEGHVIALVTEQLGGLTSIVLRSAIDLDTTTMQKARGWGEDEWMTELDRLARRGLVDGTGRATAEGVAAIARAEALTNRLAIEPWQTLDADQLHAAAAALAPIASACLPIYPQPNPSGLPTAWNPLLDPEALDVSAAPLRSSAGT